MTNPGRPEGFDPVESLIDGLIHDILTEAGAPTTAAVYGKGPMAALIETVMASSRTTSRASMLERLLLAQTMASALADALAPALAETLTPEIMKALEHYTPGERGGQQPAVGVPQEKTRKAEQK